VAVAVSKIRVRKSYFDCWLELDDLICGGELLDASIRNPAGLDELRRVRRSSSGSAQPMLQQTLPSMSVRTPSVRREVLGEYLAVGELAAVTSQLDGRLKAPPRAGPDSAAWEGPANGKVSAFASRQKSVVAS
jgi:hypothetical protein